MITGPNYEKPIDIPLKSKQRQRRLRGIGLGGGQVGCGIWWALNALKLTCEIPLWWADIHNNSLGRYLNEYGNIPLQLPPKVIELAATVPRFNNKPNPHVGRFVEQLRIIECLRAYGYSDKSIVTARYDNELMLQLIDDFDIDFAIVGAFGGHISQEVVRRLQNRIWICHPTFELKDKDLYLPLKSRGAAIIEHIVTEPLPTKIQVAMLEVAEGWDAGKIVARSEVFGSRYFSPRERGPNARQDRVISTVAGIGHICGQLVRYNLLPLLFNVRELVDQFNYNTLVRMGYSNDQIHQGWDLYKSERKNKKK